MARISVEKMGASSDRRAVKQTQPIIAVELERGSKSRYVSIIERSRDFWHNHLCSINCVFNIVSQCRYFNTICIRSYEFVYLSNKSYIIKKMWYT
jgi:hypothetical protein